MIQIMYPRSQQTCSIKRQILNLSDFVSHMVSVATKFCHSMKAATDNSNQIDVVVFPGPSLQSTLQTSYFKLPTIILTHFWRLEVWNQGVGMFGFFWGLFPCSADDHILAMFLTWSFPFMHKFYLLLRTTVTLD